MDSSKKNILILLKYTKNPILAERVKKNCINDIFSKEVICV